MTRAYDVVVRLLVLLLLLAGAPRVSGGPIVERVSTAAPLAAPRTVARGLAADAWMETGVNATAAMVSMKRVGSLGRRRSSVLVTKNPDARWLRAGSRRSSTIWQFGRA